MPFRFIVFRSLSALRTACAVLAAISSFATVAVAAPASPYAYAILGMGDVELATYSTVIGDVYAGEDLTLKFGYGIQGPSAGDMYARGDFTIESLSDVVGDVFTNGDATLEGSAEVSGSVTYATTYTKDFSAKAGGFVQQPDSVPLVGLPNASSFSHGQIDIISDEGLVLVPGSYRNVTQEGLFDDMYLTSGQYFIRNLSLLNSTKLHLDIVGNQPIEIYVTDDILIGSGFDVYVNGALVGSDGSLPTALASLVLFETHGDLTIEPGFLNYFFGTIFAPFGDVEMDLQDMYGSILAGRDIRGNVYLNHVPSAVIPEPSALVTLLAGVAILGLAALRRPRKSQ